MNREANFLSSQHQVSKTAMDTRQKYLNGDIEYLGNINKIVPRRLELPLLMQTSWVINIYFYGFSHVKKTQIYWQFFFLLFFSVSFSQKFKSERTCLELDRDYSVIWNHMIINFVHSVILHKYKYFCCSLAGYIKCVLCVVR